jgi:FkbH-like protein
VLLADSTISGLAPFLSDPADPPPFTSTVAPFDRVVTSLIDENASHWIGSPDVAVVWTRPHCAIEGFGRLVDNERVSLDDILTEVDAFVGYLQRASAHVKTLLVPTWTAPAYDRGVGLLSLHPAGGTTYTLLRMNARLAEGVARIGNAYVLDAARWIGLAGPAAVNPKLWHLGKIAFGPDVFRHAATDIKAAVRALRGLSRKLIVLDLDDTLWGGIVGDVGWEHLALGGHDPVGEAYAAFQRALKALTRRGIVLGIVSKNTEAVALEAVDRHPEMVLRRDDFVGWRINWEDKAGNIADLASELNLGLQSVVFIDDNPAERARVREALPEVLVPEWPVDRLLYEKALKELTCFDAAAITDEDRARTVMYVSERRREETKELAQSVEEYLLSLQLRISCFRLDAANLQRAAQLLNKTNQMNLATRRLTEAELQQWAATRGHHVFVFRVQDRFGDHGLTGLASLSESGPVAEVRDFVLSCRVFGRGVEETMLHSLVECARQQGARRIEATYRQTPKNQPCLEFFESKSGFGRDGERDVFAWPVERPYPLPGHVALEPSGGTASPGVGVALASNVRR